MWLNLIFLSAASLAVGFVVGWIAASPRRWDAWYRDGRAVPGERSGGPTNRSTNMSR